MNARAALIAQMARARGLDPAAVLAIASVEGGFNGSIGDHGTSFGPFQLHEGGALPRGISNPNAWANSRAGIAYALDKMAGVAGGLHGQQAVSAISSRFERPANVPGEISNAMARYGQFSGGKLPAGSAKAPLPAVGGIGGSGGSPATVIAQQLLGQSQLLSTPITQNPSAMSDPSTLLAMAMMRNAYTQSAQPAAGPQAPAASGGQPLQGVSGKGGGFLSPSEMLKIGRKDQGQDGQTTPGGAIYAPGAGYVVDVKSDPNGFGPAYPIVHFTSGRYAGKDIYLGHTIAAVKPGEKFGAGAVLSHTGTTPIGNASVPGWFEIGYAQGGLPGPNGQPVPF